MQNQRIRIRLKAFDHRLIDQATAATVLAVLSATNTKALVSLVLMVQLTVPTCKKLNLLATVKKLNSGLLV